MTRQVRVGKVVIGGGAPVSVQTMSNVDPHNEASLVKQARSCEELGCDLIRFTVPDVRAAEVLGRVRRQIGIPVVADIHFDYKCALASIANGVDALRLNPGNIGGQSKVREVARAAKAAGVPIRIGVNLGSLEGDLRGKLDSHVEVERGRSELIAECLCESAMRHVRMLEAEDFRDIVISVKASNVESTLASYRMLHEKCDYPLHLGVTEAGTFLPGTVRSSVALGILLSEGIGDTIRVSLTDDPTKEVRVGMEILRSLGMRPMGPCVTSCPTCGRTKADVFRVAAEVETALEKLHLPKYPHVAVMGCVVNGPGEAKGAEVALCGGNGEFMLYVKGNQVGKVSEAEATQKVIDYVLHSK